MKKNVMMRAASFLLVAVLLTTSIISGTYAKYTTTASGSDQARVAYWGFNQAAATTIDLFDGNYDTTVQATAGSVDGFDNVVAPGTRKEASFSFGYTNYKNDQITAPEVAYTFTITPTITGDYTALDDNPNFRWTLQKGSETIQKFDKAQGLIDAIKALSGSDNGSKEYNPGQLPGNFSTTADVYKIGWEWDYDDTGKNGATDDTIAAQDAKDTTMGNAQSLSNVTVKIEISATQKD